MIDRAPKLDREVLRARLRADFEAAVEAFADSIHDARDGHWIDDSEEVSRVALDCLKR